MDSKARLRARASGVSTLLSRFERCVGLVQPGGGESNEAHLPVRKRRSITLKSARERASCGVLKLTRGGAEQGYHKS
jgi:hypothetical protein